MGFLEYFFVASVFIGTAWFGTFFMFWGYFFRALFEELWWVYHDSNSHDVKLKDVWNVVWNDDDVQKCWMFRKENWCMKGWLGDDEPNVYLWPYINGMVFIIKLAWCIGKFIWVYILKTIVFIVWGIIMWFFYGLWGIFQKFIGRYVAEWLSKVVNKIGNIKIKK